MLNVIWSALSTWLSKAIALLKRTLAFKYKACLLSELVVDVLHAICNLSFAAKYKEAASK